ncbi:MAG: bifunctional diguanylate cyclase/phosphodiesterase [Rubrivivax sp.]
MNASAAVSEATQLLVWLPLALGALLLIACGAAATVGALWWRQRRRSEALTRSLDAATQVLDSSRQASGSGLVTRPEFDLALDDAVLRCDARRHTASVLFLDIDGFGAVNDTHGHGIGDRVLREIVERVHATTPTKTSAARLGGDEVLVLVECGLDDAKLLAAALQAVLAEPIDAGAGLRVHVTVSIGVAVYPQHGARARIESYAKMAMRAVKDAGGNAWSVFDPQMAIDQREHAMIVADLRHAIARKQFELFYQPKVDAGTLQITAAEALLRWHRPQHGVVSPAVFIPLAERYGLIGDLGNWVIDEACRQAGVWRKAGLRMRVAINLSAFQMRQDDLVQRLEKALRTNKLQPERFTVEITESLALENTQATQRTFEGLRRAGLHVAIDDFGAGQTSIAYLRQLPASELKMDMSLVRDLAHSADARAIAEAVIKLAHALDRRVVAEGVETPDQRDLLVEMGCDELQGFLFAKPMSATAIGLWAMDEGPDHHPDFRPSLFQETQAAL